MTTSTRPELTAAIPTGCKPSRVTSREANTPVLASAYLRKTRKGFELHATDSKVAVRLPVTVTKPKGDRRRPPLKEGFVPVDALKAIEQGQSFTARNGHVETGTVAFKRVEVGKYPELGPLFPQRKPKKSLVLGLNTKLLRNLAEALGSDVVQIELDLAQARGGQYRKPYHVRPIVGEGDGLLMPVLAGPTASPRRKSR